MKSIQTVTGVMYENEVNQICVHEHLLIDLSHQAIAPETKDEKEQFYSEITMKDLGALRRNPYIIRSNLLLDDISTAVSELQFVQNTGCNLLIDLTTVGIGRNVEKLKQISNQCDCNIVAGCGLYTYDSDLGEYSDYSIKELTNWMLNEIKDGVGESGIKPGVIGEIGLSDTIYPVEKRALTAAYETSLLTNLPVYIHTYPWSRVGLDALDLALAHGLEPNMICLCHLDVSFDYDYIFRVLEKGVYVEFDNLGKEFFFEPQKGSFAGGPFETDSARAIMLKQLVDKGYEKQLLVANDVCLKTSLHAYGGWGYDHLFSNFIPMMKYYGLSDEKIDRIVKQNAIDFLFRK